MEDDIENLKSEIEDKEQLILDLKYELSKSKERVLFDFLESLCFSIDDELENHYSELTKNEILNNLKVYISEFKKINKIYK